MCDLKIYLITCDKTSHILPATIYLYKKFIKPCPLIRILGFTKPNLPEWENIEFIQLAKKQKKINLWSKYIYDYLITINDKLIFFALDDFFPIDFINKKCYNYVIEYMKNNDNIGLCVASQEPSSCKQRNEVDKIIIDNEDFFVYKRKKNINYQLCLQPCIWNKEYLINFLKTNYTPWTFETEGSKIANKIDNYYNIATSNSPNDKPKCLLPYSYQSSLSKKWKNKISVLGLKNEYVKELINKKLLPKEKLIIGAWKNYIPWNENFKLLDFRKLTNTNKKGWYQAYKFYYS